MDYVLITPVKDEEKNLHNLANCVTSQTILPKIWVLVDDGSMDSTPLVVRRLAEKYPWIKGLRVDRTHQRSLDEHFGKICNLAFRHALRICEEKQLSVNFLVKVDADMVFSNDCVESTLTKFEKDEQLGIASPHVQDVLPNVLVGLQKTGNCATLNQNNAWYDFYLEPSDGLRVYRRRTFENIGGIPETMAPDTAALAKAKIKGWKVKRFKDIISFKARETGSSISDGYILQGFRYYYLDYHPLIVISNVALKIGKVQIDRAVMILTGYIKGVIAKKEKIDDEEIRNYFRKRRLKEIICSFGKGVFGR